MHLRAIKANQPAHHILEACAVWRLHAMGSQRVPVIQDVSVTISPGEFVSIVGPSGSGKSSLLGLLGTLDKPTAGDVLIDGVSVSSLDHAQLARVRASTLGFVFQNCCLLPRLTAMEQLLVPALYGDASMRTYRARARSCLDAVGLREFERHAPHQLSGGQKMRVAIARALLNEPRVLLADEPTGALDQKAGAEIMDLLAGLNAQGITVVIVTHDAAVAQRAGRAISMCDGRVTSDRRRAPAMEIQRASA